MNKNIIALIGVILTSLMVVSYANAEGTTRIFYLILSGVMIGILPHVKEFVKDKENGIK